MQNYLHCFTLQYWYKNKCRRYVIYDGWWMMQPNHVLETNEKIIIAFQFKEWRWLMFDFNINSRTYSAPPETKICHHPHTEFLKWWGDETQWNTTWQVKNSRSWHLTCSASASSVPCWLLTFGKLTSCQSLWQSVCPAWLADCDRKKVFLTSPAEFELQKLLFSDFSHYDLQLS